MDRLAYLQDRLAYWRSIATDYYTQAPTTKAAAIARIGGLSTPSKMPGRGYGLPAYECITGNKLRSVAGSTCSVCYALKGRYVFRETLNAQARRLVAIEHALSSDSRRAEYVEAFSVALQGERWFRWHDSGDLQGIGHLGLILSVCRATPKTHHWLPTREYSFVRQYYDLVCYKRPSNLCVRVSAHLIDGPRPKYPQTSTVVSDDSKRTCPAPDQGGACLDCRKCWSRRVRNVAYHKH